MINSYVTLCQGRRFPALKALLYHSVSFVSCWRHCSRAPMDLSAHSFCVHHPAVSSPFFCIGGARFPNDGIHQNLRMFPLCSSRIITEEGPVLLAVSLDYAALGKSWVGIGVILSPPVTARWTVPSYVYHGCSLLFKVHSPQVRSFVFHV